MLLVLAALLLPLGASAGDQVRTEGTLVEGPVRAEDSWVGKDSVSGIDTSLRSKNWVFVVKVGNDTYTGNAQRFGGIVGGKGPKQDDWPLNSTVKVVFHTRMGSLLMDLKSPTGKERCGKIKCEKSAEDSEEWSASARRYR